MSKVTPEDPVRDAVMLWFGGGDPEQAQLWDAETDSLMEAIRPAMLAKAPSLEGDVERVWDELRKQCCSDPASAKRIVMVSKSDLAAAILASQQGQ